MRTLDDHLPADDAGSSARLHPSGWPCAGWPRHTPAGSVPACTSTTRFPIHSRGCLQVTLPSAILWDGRVVSKTQFMPDGPEEKPPPRVQLVSGLLPTTSESTLVEWCWWSPMASHWLHYTAGRQVSRLSMPIA
jgi:hypothetical protein